MTGDKAFVLLPPLPAVRNSDGTVTLTQKFVDGMNRYREFWTGPIRVLMEPSAFETSNLDNVRIRPQDLSFGLEIVHFDSSRLAVALQGSAVVMAGVDRTGLLGRLCRSLGVGLVYNFETSLKTRLQIMLASTRNPLRRLRRAVRECNAEGRNLLAVREATGIQCNGTPTYDAYRRFNPKPLLYFDTRTTRDMMATEAGLTPRLERLKAGGPLRLAFSGRLDAIKGVMALPQIAEELRLLGRRFTLAVIGDGPLTADLSRAIRERGLEEHVALKGVLDFKRELMPYMRSEVDLFVCPHVQGDPSCTYLETMSCGVPIVGFGNEAFSGILGRADVGWKVPMRDTRTAARVIAGLDRDRESLASASWRALEFARQNSFEATFQARVEHLQCCSLR
jgi:glycosyltransferase involved in cell wall biosynthesis